MSINSIFNKKLYFMPIDPVTGSIIVGGANLLGQGFNAWSQGRMNKKTRKWNEKMYDRQRQDALADFDRKWNLETQYNSPEEQMRRFAAAGLNPNLIYGQDNAYSAAPVRSAQVEGWNPRAPSVDLGGVAAAGLGAYYDAQIKPVQVDNLKAANAVALQEAYLKAAQTASTIAGTKMTELQTSLAAKLQNYTLEGAALNLKKVEAEIGRTEAETGVMLDRNEREIAMNAVNVAKGAEEILNLRASRAKTEDERREIQERINLLKHDVTIRSFDARLAQMGIKGNYGDILRIVGLVVSSEKWGNVVQKVRDRMSQFFNKK